VTRLNYVEVSKWLNYGTWVGKISSQGNNNGVIPYKDGVKPSMFNLKTNLCTGLRISMSLEIFKSIT
jgi:hypothetical protein